MSVFVTGAGVIPNTLLPKGYIQLEYIESTGTQYIDTNFFPSEETSLEIMANVKYIGTYPSLFGTRNSNEEMFWLYCSDENLFSVKIGTETYRINSPVNEDNICIINSNIITIGKTSISIETVPFQSQYSMYIFATNNKNSIQYYSEMRFYYCKIYNLNKITRNFIPCKNPSNEIGLYDTINKVFYSNAGSGSFVAGPEL